MIAILSALYLWADRFCGGGWAWRPSFIGRPIYWAAPLLLFPGMLFGIFWPTVAWLVWRWPSWDLQYKGRALFPSAKLDPRTPREIGCTFARHCIPCAAILLGGSVWLLAFPFVATALAVWLGREADKGKDVTPTAEVIRGAAFGLLVAL